jgi:hypothetical protein
MGAAWLVAAGLIALHTVTILDYVALPDHPRFYEGFSPTYVDHHGLVNVALLADPNASAGISYYGRFQSLGTLFWENVAGLRASAAILCAGTDDEALRLLSERGVTHLAISSTGLFLGEYCRLLHPDRPP